MKQLKKNEHGFSAVELVLVIIIIVLIGGVSWIVYKNHHKTNLSNNLSTSTKLTTAPKRPTTTTIPYAGWKTYTLKQEKITFRYPSTWQLKDKSDSNNDY